MSPTVLIGAATTVPHLSLATRFLIGSLIILVAGMSVIGIWVTRQIEDGVVHRSASTTAVYVDSLIASSVQELGDSNQLTEEHADRLRWLMTETTLGQQIAEFRVWDLDGNVVFSSVGELEVNPQSVDADYLRAVTGEVTAHIGTIEGESAGSDLPGEDLLEIYSPIRKTGTDEVIAVAEFYYGTADLQDDLDAAARRSWLVVAGITLVIYLLLAVFVQRASNTITRQQHALADQVHRLTDLLAENRDLDARVRTAAKRTTALNERFLRRVSAELHDGPAQDMSVALLRLDHVQEQIQTPNTDISSLENDLATIKRSMTSALNEIRATSSGLILPQLGDLTLTQTVEHAVRAHSLRSGANVSVSARETAGDVDISLKIAIYRVVQEALANASRHAPGAEQSVNFTTADDNLILTIADTGPGFDTSLAMTPDHLGLLGMRERIESLGGLFQIESAPGSGTRIIATLPLIPEGEPHV